MQTLPVTADRTGYYLGKDDIKFAEAIASEPIMSHPHIHLSWSEREGADVETEDRYKGKRGSAKMDMRGCEKENIIVDNIGDVVILIIAISGQSPARCFLGLKDR